MTVAPTRTSLIWICVSLCNVAFVIMTLPMVTGARTANGVAFPVRPKFTSMAFGRRALFDRRHLASDGPPWRPRCESEYCPLTEVLDLHHDPVDLETQAVPLFGEPLDDTPDLVDGLDQGGVARKR
jgi:hypothetical protein